ncbi:hypothetical protein V6N11_039513 [Hibiscus sabdariffa]|uniref:Uncharacterized protein n=1 Tax=Hibiscus sabdariffa TaxID=183260 RepID=A0ABR2SNX0_9ROSI
MEKNECFMTFIYGPSYVQEKQGFWDSLSSLRDNSSERWCLIGNSNIVVKLEEKLGVPFDTSQAKWFYDFVILWTILVYLNFRLKGVPSRGQIIGMKMMLYLKNLIVCLSLLNGVIHSLERLEFWMYKRDFEFEARWLLEEDCKAKVEESWLSSCNGNILRFGLKLNNKRVKLRQSRKQKRGQNKVKEEDMKEKIKSLRGKLLN